MAQFRTDLQKNLPIANTHYEVVMLSDQLTPGGTLTDSFGRLRVSDPYTIFDSQHKDVQNYKWDTLVTGTGSATHNANESSIFMTIGTALGDRVLRETKRTMPYQPGKTLLIMNTFVFNEPKENLVQRLGYYNDGNGIYFENDGTTNYLVLRSKVTGSVVERRIPQTEWNVDKFDGTGISAQVDTTGSQNGGLDVTKGNIFWIDIEWLGVGDVRCGFVVNGSIRIAHIFRNANRIASTYMTTAVLPLRYEIYNAGTTASGSTLKQICSTVISEGGYSQVNLTRSITNPIAGKTLATAGTPMVSIRLKNGRTDSVVTPVSIDFYGLQATAYKYQIIIGNSLTGASWATTDALSAVEYDLSATESTGGAIVKEGIFKGQASVDTLDLTYFDRSLQLTRGINATAGDIVTVFVTPTTNNDQAIASLSWQEHIN